MSTEPEVDARLAEFHLADFAVIARNDIVERVLELTGVRSDLRDA